PGPMLPSCPLRMKILRNPRRAMLRSTSAKYMVMTSGRTDIVPRNCAVCAGHCVNLMVGKSSPAVRAATRSAIPEMMMESDPRGLWGPWNSRLPSGRIARRQRDTTSATSNPTVSSNRFGLTELLSPDTSPLTPPTIPGRASPASNRSLLLICVICALPQNCLKANVRFRELSMLIFLAQMLVALFGFTYTETFQHVQCIEVRDDLMRRARSRSGMAPPQTNSIIRTYTCELRDLWLN